MSEPKYMQRALALAVENVRSNRGGPFGAVVVRNGEIIAEGTNLVTTINDPTAHAEVLAIREACAKLNTFELADCEIYASCEPCPMCLGAIYWSRLQRIYYANTRVEAAGIGFDDDLIYREIGVHPASRSVPAEQLLSDDPMGAFRAWMESPDKIEY
jgi:tRNA(Arg) A34 adenosine deaminase TadA